MNSDKPYQFQSDAISWLKQTRDNGFGFKCEAMCGLIGDEMGLGKTVTALESVKDLVQSGKRGLFIVPGSTIIQWQRQWDKWVNDSEPDPFGSDGLFALSGSKDRLPRDVSVVMSHSLLAKAVVIEKLAAANLDFCVIDEIHKFGSHGTKRIKHLWALINLTPSRFEYGRIGLSGTPVRNYAREIYNIAHFIAPEVFRVYEDFCRKYLTYDRKALWNPRQFHSDFAPFYIRRTVKEVQTNLPEIRRTKLYTEITDPFIIQAYNKQLDLLDNFMNHAGKIEAFSLLGYLIKLRHLTGIAKAREASIIEPIRDYLNGEGSETGEARKIIIGIHHHFVASELMKRLKEFRFYLIRGGQSIYEREAIKDAFIKDPAPSVLLLSIKAGGEGIDGLQYSGATKAYIFEHQWNAADELQFEKRIHRTGQTQSCNIELTIASGTIDEFFVNLKEDKLKYTTQVEDENWEHNPAFLRKLAETVVSNRLSIPKYRDIEEFEDMIRPKADINEVFDFNDMATL